MDPTVADVADLSVSWSYLYATWVPADRARIRSGGASRHPSGDMGFRFRNSINCNLYYPIVCCR